MRNYSYFAMPLAKTVNHGLESLSYIGSKLWDSIPSHMKEIDSINEFKHIIKTWKPDLCSDVCSQRLFPFAFRYTFPFLVQLFVGIYGIYLKFDLGPLALISILFINIAIVM